MFIPLPYLFSSPSCCPFHRPPWPLTSPDKSLIYTGAASARSEGRRHRDIELSSTGPASFTSSFLHHKGYCEAPSRSYKNSTRFLICHKVEGEGSRVGIIGELLTASVRVSLSLLGTTSKGLRAARVVGTAINMMPSRFFCRLGGFNVRFRCESVDWRIVNLL